MSDLTQSGPDTDQEDVFTESLLIMSLTELQDVFGHLDREKYPERIEAVRQQMHARIEHLKGHRESEDLGGELARPFRRVWGSVLDVFISLFPLVLYLGFQMLAAASGGGEGAQGGGGRGGARGGRGGRGGAAAEETWLDAIVDYITSPEAVWATVETYGPYLLGFLVYRALYAIPQLVRSGSLPGMREAGLKVVSSSDNELTYAQAGIRFVSAYALGILTFGVGHLWAFLDKERRTVFDKIAGTRVIRLARTWEKPADQRMLED